MRVFQQKSGNSPASKREDQMLKRKALIAGTVVIASFLALAQSANAQYPGYGYGRPMAGYPGPAPRVLPYPQQRPIYNYAPPVLPYPQQRPIYNYYPQPQPAPQRPSNQGAQWNTTSNGWPQFPTLGQDVQGAQQFYNNVIAPVCTLFGC
jgi:hypothetical protein